MLPHEIAMQVTLQLAKHRHQPTVELFDLLLQRFRFDVIATPESLQTLFDVTELDQNVGEIGHGCAIANGYLIDNWKRPPLCW